MSHQHLARLVQAYLQRPGAQPGGRSPDDAFTLLSPIDGHCVAIDWCPVDGTALFCAHPSEAPAARLEAVADLEADDGLERVQDLGRCVQGQWWLHEDLRTGQTTLGLRADVLTWGVDDFSCAFERFCRRLSTMGTGDADSAVQAPLEPVPLDVTSCEMAGGLWLVHRA